MVIKNPINIKNQTNSTSYNTGALICSGGIGVAGNIQSGGYIGVNSAIGSSTYPLNVTGSALISNYLGINGFVGSSTYPLNVNGNIVCNNIVSTSAADIYNGATFSSYYAIGNLAGNSSSYTVSVGGSTLLSGKLVVGTTSTYDPSVGTMGHVNIILYLGLNGNAPNSSYALYTNTTYYTNQNVYSNGTNTISDIRTKKNISLIDDNDSLVKLRLLNPKKFKYIDRDDTFDYGFIAQEVINILPESTSIMENFISDIYDSAIVSDYNDYSLITLNNKKITFTTVNVKIKATGKKDYILIPIELVDDNSFTVEKINETDIFIYGKQVNDFHHLNKNDIYITAISAFKELDRQVQAKKIINSNLLERLKILEQLI